MNFGLDFDDTFTSAPDLWRSFIEQAENSGHKVYVVTCRRDTEANREEVIGEIDGCKRSVRVGLAPHRFLFTGLSAKRWFTEQKGIRIDVWIDDDPKCIEHGK